MLTALLISLTLASQAREESPVRIEHREFLVRAEDGVSIAVHQKRRVESDRALPVLLVHGTWSNASVWDFPGRSVMDHLARRGHDVYALDLRGMGNSDKPDYGDIGLVERTRDVTAVVRHIRAATGRRPVLMGWSQGALLAGLVAAQNGRLLRGVGLLSAPGDGFFAPPDLQAILAGVLATGAESYLPPPEILFAIGFGTDPVTGAPTIGASAFSTFVARSQTDSVRVVAEMADLASFRALMSGAWRAITMPALVVDGAQDLTVGTARATALYEALGSERKDLIIFRRNAHTWFLEDNFASTMRAFDAFLNQF
jgi:pimeloyl-ACP methyl ester carboxylesterase